MLRVGVNEKQVEILEAMVIASREADPAKRSALVAKARKRWIQLARERNAIDEQIERREDRQ